MKFKKINELLQVSLEGNLAQAKFRAAIPAQDVTEEAKKVLAGASLWYGQPKNTVQDNVPIQTPQAPVLNEERYVFATFRALSQVHLVNRGLDFSTPGVLESAVSLLEAKTVYPNHEFGDIYNWLGVVSKSFWDAAGAKSNSTPGINCEIKVDAYLNYRIACGLMMSPPAVNSMSLTVLFEFEYSHPQMAIESKWKFFDMLGEEVDGEIVRLIVTRIVEIWEASLVPVGEDRLAKNIGGEADDNKDFADMSAKPAAEIQPPPNSNEEKTMKLTNEQKTELGIEFDGEDVPETEIFKAATTLAAKTKEFDGVNIAELTEQAKAGVGFIAKQRDEVCRLAKLAELGSEEGDLEKVVSQTIEKADFNTLVELEKYYGKKVAERFPKSGRSSQENSEAVESAGGVKKNTTVPKKVGLH